MAAGLAQLRELERIDGWALLEKNGARSKLTRETLRELKALVGFSPHWFHVLSLFHHEPVTDLPARTKRPGKIRGVLQGLSRSPRLLCSVAIRNRIPFTRILPTTSNVPQRSSAKVSLGRDAALRVRLANVRRRRSAGPYKKAFHPRFIGLSKLRLTSTFSVQFAPPRNSSSKGPEVFLKA